MIAASAAIGLAGCTQGAGAVRAAGASSSPPTPASSPAPSSPPAPPTHVARPVPAAVAAPEPVRLLGPPVGLTRVPLPGGSITALPGDGSLVALTVDDGSSTEVVAAYTEFARASGMRLTFFLNGQYDSWTENASALGPLVDSGQVQLANHTYSHADLTSLSDADVVDELSRNDDFIRTTYGVSGAPYFRPPFGYHDARVDDLAASIGYTVPTLWYGSLSDSGLITEDQLTGFADQWLLAQHIVIGHANFPTVTRCFDHILELVHERGLVPVTLNDVFEA